MAKLVCTACSAIWGRYKSRCGSCGSWQTIIDVDAARSRGVPVPLNEVPGGADYKVIKSGSAAVDEIFSGRGGIARGKSYLLTGEPGQGKCLGRGTQVIRADGSISAVEDIHVGDLLMGPDSKPRRVTRTVYGHDQLYQITPVKGAPWVCTGNHTLVLGGTRKLRGKYREVTVERAIAERNNQGRLDAHWKLLRSDGIEFPRVTTPIDPYLLGVWIGDGSFRQPIITNCEPEIRRYLREISPTYGVTYKETFLPDKNTYTIRLTRDDWRGKPAGALVSFFQGCSRPEGKVIPKEFLLNDMDSRLQLLAGVIDTDGHLSDGSWDITTKYPALRDQILFLARSLGFAAYASKKIATIKSIGFEGIYWRICISGDTSRVPCKVPRRAARGRRQIKRVTVTGFDIAPIGAGEFFGFELDEDRRFLLGDFTITHNSTLALGITGYVARTKSRRVAYATTEEDESAIKSRAMRLGIDPSNILSVRSQSVEQLCEQAAAADFAVLDSVQGMRDRSGIDPEKIAKYITDNHAHVRDCAWIIVGQVIKSGEAAGTEGLQHVVDAVVHISGDPSSALRSLKADKSRMGPTDRRAFLRMGTKGLEDVPDASSYLLADRTPGVAGSVVAAVVAAGEQTAFLVEVQALVVACAEKEKPQVSCVGYSPSRLKQLRGVLGVSGIDLSDANVYVSVVGGIPVDDIALDLPVAAALVSALRRKPLPPKACLWGEIGLTGEIRACREQSAREREAQRAGYAPVAAKGGLRALLDKLKLNA